MILVLRPYIALMRLDKPIGILLLLWPTLIALWLASKGIPNLQIATIFIGGVILMRSAGCVINDYADRDFDLHVTRTKNRPITSGKINSNIALKIFVFLLLLALFLASYLNTFTILLSCIAAGLAIIYPFAKRVTNYPQFILGLAFAWGIPMAYAQIQGHLSSEAWVLFASIMAWVIAYDTQYAMADKLDDLKVGIKSTAIAFGTYDKLIVLVLQLCCLLGLYSIGIANKFDLPFYLALIAALCLAIYQQWLIKDRLPQRCMAAFLNNNYFGLVIFLGVVLS
jgi:4-hydroxybenzoate polyprenyltransferase